MEEKKKRSTALELIIISCNDLKSTFSFFGKLNTYVTVSVVQDDDRNLKHHTRIQFQKTLTDRNGDRNPIWNHSMNFQTIPDDKVVSLKFNVMCENSLFGDRKVGDARLPLEDLQFDKILRFSVLSVKNSDGKERGRLNMSWKFSGERAKIEEDKMKSCSSMKFNADTCRRAFQGIKWPILPPLSVSDVEEAKTSCHDGSCNDKILRPLEMKSLSFDTGFDQLGKDYKNYSISGSAKWEIKLDPRAGRFPGLLARNLSECSY